MSGEVDSVEAVELTEEQGKALLDKRCRKLLGVGAEEFMREYDAGGPLGPRQGNRAGDAYPLLPVGRTDD